MDKFYNFFKSIFGKEIEIIHIQFSGLQLGI